MIREDVHEKAIRERKEAWDKVRSKCPQYIEGYCNFTGKRCRFKILKNCAGFISEGGEYL